MRNDVHLEARTFYRIHGKTYAIDRDRALLRDVARERGGRFDLETPASADILERGDGADAIDVALHEVTAEAIGEPQRLLEVHVAAGLEPRRDGQRRSR